MPVRSEEETEEKNRRAKKRLASNKEGERAGRRGGGGEMDGRLKGSEKYEKGDGIPGPRNKKKL